MTYEVQKIGFSGYTLCDKLKAQYGDRTAATIYRGIEENERRKAQRAQTAQNSRPSQNVVRRPASRTAPAYTPSRTSDTRTTPVPASGTRSVRTAPENRQTTRPQTTRPQTTRPQIAQRRPNVMRDTVVHKMPKPVSDKTPLEASVAVFPRAYRRGEKVREYAANERLKPHSRTMDSAPAEKNAFLTFIGNVRRFFLGEKSAAELRLKKAPFPLATVALLAVCTIMVMVMMNSFAQLNEYRKSVSDLEYTQSQLSAKQTQLSGLVEAREDIRVIEQTATEELGMVSSDLVRSRFVSLADSDRVEVIAAPEEDQSGALATLLSAIGENLGRLSEYFN